MAPTDPTTPPTVLAPDTDQLDAWRQYNDYTAQAAKNVDNVNSISAMAKQTFDAMDNGMQKLGMSFSSLDVMTSKQAAGFGALTTSILGSKEAFTSLTDVDTSKLLTFTKQVKDMQEMIAQSPAYKVAAEGVSKLKQKLEELTISGNTAGAALTRKAIREAEDGLKSLTKVVSDSAMAMLTGADNSLRLQNAMFQLTMQAGDSKDLFEGFGKDGLFDGMSEGFENIGDVMTHFNTRLEEGSAALGGNQELAAKYMAEINRMPGGFKAIIQPLKIGSDETNILTASIQYATGAGRKQEEVFSDMSKAMSEYGISGGDALRFSARMTEVSKATGGQLKDVQTALHGVADAFKMYKNNGADATKMTQGMADSMRSYVSELTAVGVPAQNAIEMFKNYSTQISSMTIGQQAFLSTMGGGPGGLRGALTVQDDLAKGNFDKIRKQVEQTLKKTSGPLITREEAMKSEQGSAQYVRQMQVLQQGPLGSMAKSPGEADSLIRAMKEGKAFKPKEGATPEKALQDTMIKGQEWQKGSYTELTKINTNLQAMILRGGTANLATTQKMFTAAGARSIAGGSGYGEGISPDAQERVSTTQRTIATAAPNSEIFKQTAEAVKNLPKTFGDAWNSFKESIKGGANTESTQQSTARMLAAIKEAQAAGNMTDKQKESLNTLQTNFSGVKSTSTAESPAAPTIGPTGMATPKMAFTKITDFQRPGQRIPLPAATTTTATGAPGTPTTGRQAPGVGGGAPGQAVPVTLAPGSAITVNFTGACPHCGTNVRHATESTISPQSGAK